MKQAFDRAYQALSDWADMATSGGWLDANDIALLETIERRTAADLFDLDSVRPLVIGFFGGTGVGKSSLLNRLAGEPLARVGVERPTSREVTLYLHKDYPVWSLPAEFPVDKTHIAYHRDTKRKHLVWIDMPDIDSTEIENRKLALAWLPYIDWVIYVVSPERYRDDAGWQVLRDRGHRHAWMFVMNQCDLSDPQQLEDLRVQLVEAGLKDPIVLATQCVNEAIKDDFGELESVIQRAIERHGLIELQRIGILARFSDLQDLARRYAERLGDDSTWRRFRQIWREHSSQSLKKLVDILRWPIELIAQRFRESDRGIWFRRKSKTASAPAPVDDDILASLWPGAAQQHIDDLISQLVIDAHMNDLATLPLQRRLSDVPPRIKEDLLIEATQHLGAAIANPGTAIQRYAHRVAGGLTFLLPLIAASWAGVHIITRFYSATRAQAPFLGFDFAVHTILLVSVAWVLAFLLKRWTRPSLVASVRRGLQCAVGETAEKLRRRLDDGLQELRAECEHLQVALNKVVEKNIKAHITTSSGAVLTCRGADRN